MQSSGCGCYNDTICSDGYAYQISCVSSGAEIEGNIAKIHYKVCDDGEYWLLDGDGKRVAKKNGNYVPGRFLCQNENGFGDYIIMNIGADGMVEDWKVPSIRWDEWCLLETKSTESA